MKRAIDFVIPLAMALTLVLAAARFLPAAQQESGAPLEVNLAYEDQEIPPAKTRMRVLSATAPEHCDTAALDSGLPENAELRFTTYGGENSRMVAIAVDAPSKTLWIDRNRDRQWNDGERVASTSDFQWRTTLPAEFVTGVNQFHTVDLTVQLEWDPDEQSLRLGTIGSMRGATELAGQQLAVVRTDDNSNGRWLDAEDRVWVDFNQDGRFDPFGERFAIQTMLVRGSQRFVVAADEWGELFSLNDQIATGSLAADFNLMSIAATIEAVEIDLVSREGVPIHLEAAAKPLEVPSADYRVTRVYCVIRSGASSYSFLFARRDDAARLDFGAIGRFDPFRSAWRVAFERRPHRAARPGFGDCDPAEAEHRDGTLPGGLQGRNAVAERAERRDRHLVCQRPAVRPGQQRFRLRYVLSGLGSSTGNRRAVAGSFGDRV